MKFLILILSIISLSSFNQVQYLPKKDDSSSTSIFKKVMVAFSFNEGGCRYDILAFIETNDGTGVGMMTQTCGKNKPRTTYFNLYSGVLARITPDRLGDFRGEDEEIYEPTVEEINGIVDGYNANPPRE